MKSPFDFFDKIYCINLPKSTDRWSKAQTQFSKVGIADRVEKIWAEPPHDKIFVPTLKFPKGEMGVSLSQTKVLVHAIASQATNVLIFEDDVVFTDDAIDRLNEFMMELPSDWDIMFLGGNPFQPMQRVSDKVLKTTGFTCAFAYALPQKSLLKLYDSAINNISQRPYDIFTSQLSSNGNGYTLNLPICWQAAGNSVIRNAHRDYQNYLEGQWKKFS